MGEGKEAFLCMSGFQNQGERPTFPFPGCQVPNKLSICKLCALPHQGWLSSHVSFFELGIRSDLGTWAVLEADMTETLSIRKTKKSYPQRRKILGEPAREESTKSLTVRTKQGEKEVEGRTTGARNIHSVPPSRTYSSP